MADQGAKDVGTCQIQVNPTLVRELMEHPLSSESFQNRDTLCPRGTLNVQFDVSLLVPQTIRADKEPRKAAAAKKNHALSANVSAENMKAEVAKDLSALLYSQVTCFRSIT